MALDNYLDPGIASPPAGGPWIRSAGGAIVPVRTRAANDRTPLLHTGRRHSFCAGAGLGAGTTTVTLTDDRARADLATSIVAAAEAADTTTLPSTEATDSAGASSQNWRGLATGAAFCAIGMLTLSTIVRVHTTTSYSCSLEDWVASACSYLPTPPPPPRCPALLRVLPMTT